MSREKGDLHSSSIFAIERQVQLDPAEVSSRHYHDCYELYYLLSGERSYFIEKEVHHLVSGDLVLTDMYAIHKTNQVKGRSRVERILVQFKPAFLADFLAMHVGGDILFPFTNGTPVFHLDAKDQAFVCGLLIRILQENEEERRGFEDFARCMLASLLLYVGRTLMRRRPSARAAVDPLHEKMLTIVRYLNERYAEGISLDSLARAFSISRYYLCRSFRQVIGLGVVEYLNNIRVRKSQQLLRETSLPIGRIAEEVGYGTDTHFERVFKKLNRIPPLRYRKNV